MILNFHVKKKVIQVWNNIKVRTWWLLLLGELAL